MTSSPAGVALSRGFESCRLTAYPDPLLGWAAPTIGWGHTGPEVHQGMTCTQEQADAWELHDRGFAEHIVNQWVQPTLSQNQFDALVDFVYNVGPGNPEHKDGFVWLRSLAAGGQPQHSTLLEMLNASRFDAAANQFTLWANAGGKPSSGLMRRRLAERDMFLGRAA